ncbi:hypothetical protein Taro_038448 [Colocasia esculenta]|uniref:Uncharacterized protein n=1 Tax=Colocasia esculenta TaxID=4460 RepID=A0A843WDX4_COLES|nr:hypothetical protein [Colocasia esculenta]
MPNSLTTINPRDNGRPGGVQGAVSPSVVKEDLELFPFGCEGRPGGVQGAISPSVVKEDLVGYPGWCYFPSGVKEDQLSWTHSPPPLGSSTGQQNPLAQTCGSWLPRRSGPPRNDGVNDRGALVLVHQTERDATSTANQRAAPESTLLGQEVRAIAGETTLPGAPVERRLPGPAARPIGPGDPGRFPSAATSVPGVWPSLRRSQAQRWRAQGRPRSRQQEPRRRRRGEHVDGSPPATGRTSSYGSLCSGTRIVREPWLSPIPTDSAKSVEVISHLGRSQADLHLKEGKKVVGSGQIPTKPKWNQGGPVEEPGRTL